jgi:ubiquinone biosynthesis protein UbiJ
MLHSFQTLLQASVMERLTLLANHVIASEPVAQERLRAHSGRTFALQLLGWPGLLPAPPSMNFTVTPAGLLEWNSAASANAGPLPDLRLLLDASNPARSFAEFLQGSRPRIDIDGDAALAADLSWMIDNLRWDITDDLAKIIGPGPAHELSRVMRTLAGGLRQAVDALKAVAGKVAASVPNPRRPADPSDFGSGRPGR